MEIMPLPVSLNDIAARLVVTLIAGMLIGYNRSEYGKAAGLRTTVLVCLAASVAMIQLNILLPLAGRPPHSFVMNDLMRLPLGILTGVGFIGGGAILRRGDITIGVTTAATLWLVTVIGLCIGGGQILLGLAATALGLFALWGLIWIERILPREHRTTCVIDLDARGPGEEEIRRRLRDAKLSIVGFRISFGTGDRRELSFDLLQTGCSLPTEAPAFIQELAGHHGVLKVRWRAPG
jgi:putative Mg2+ transporter-C (MgtC) family protein